MIPKDPDFDWLIAARTSIQQDLLTLLRIVEDDRNALERCDERACRSVFMLLVGAAFSLWRAAFLSNIDREWEDILDTSKSILKELLTTNAVPFSTEHRTRDWMFGYYLNSALFRLDHARSRLGDVPPSEVLTRLADLHEHGLIGIDKTPEAMWDISQSGLHEMTSILRDRLHKTT